MQSWRRLCRRNPGSAADPVADRAPAAPAPRVPARGAGAGPKVHAPGAGAGHCSTRRPLSSPGPRSPGLERACRDRWPGRCARLSPRAPAGSWGAAQLGGGRPAARTPRRAARPSASHLCASQGALGATSGGAPGQGAAAARAGRPLRAGPLPRSPGPRSSSPPPQTQPDASTYPSRRGRGGSARRSPAARALCESELGGGRRGAAGAPRLLTARTLHFPLCFLFTRYRKNNRSSRRLICSPALPPNPCPVCGWSGHHPRCLWKCTLPLFKTSFLSYKENNQIKTPGAHKPPRLSTFTHPKNLGHGRRRPRGTWV